MTRAPKGLRYPLPSSGVDGWKARAEAAEKEVERLKDGLVRCIAQRDGQYERAEAAEPNLKLRDEFIVRKGLWGEFVDSLDALPPPVPTEEGRKLPPPDGGGPEPQCGYCAARFWTRQDLAQHVYQSHGGPKPVPTEEGGELGLHPATSAMVDSFALALKGKLRAAEVKYGHGDSWRSDDWADKCRADLMAHVQKGDPRDVAAYAAFCWAHGWSTTPTQAQDVAGLVEAAQGVTRAAWTDRFTMLHGHPSVAALETALAAFQSRQEGKQP